MSHTLVLVEFKANLASEFLHANHQVSHLTFVSLDREELAIRILGDYLLGTYVRMRHVLISSHATDAFELLLDNLNNRGNIGCKWTTLLYSPLNDEIEWLFTSWTMKSFLANHWSPSIMFDFS